MIETLQNKVKTHLGDSVTDTVIAHGELTVEVKAADIRKVCTTLRDTSELAFDMLIDVCGVDYLQYGAVEWSTEETTEKGFSRGVDRNALGPGVTRKDEMRGKTEGGSGVYSKVHEHSEIGFNEADRLSRKSRWEKSRFAVVYHLLSIKNNQRIRVRAFPEGDPPVIDSITDIWNAANWFEREAYDLFGIFFTGHPDLRRILTDYDFDGHPFRKDFPLIGKVAMRYDAKAKRCVYEPVAIQPRTLVPKVIRHDSRYIKEGLEEQAQGQSDE